MQLRHFFTDDGMVTSCRAFRLHTRTIEGVLLCVLQFTRFLEFTYKLVEGHSYGIAHRYKLK
jgi:hypothetical protein